MSKSTPNVPDKHALDEGDDSFAPKKLAQEDDAISTKKHVAFDDSKSTEILLPPDLDGSMMQSRMSEKHKEPEEIPDPEIHGALRLLKRQARETQLYPEALRAARAIVANRMEQLPTSPALQQKWDDFATGHGATSEKPLRKLQNAIEKNHQEQGQKR